MTHSQFVFHCSRSSTQVAKNSKAKFVIHHRMLFLFNNPLNLELLGLVVYPTFCFLSARKSVFSEKAGILLAGHIVTGQTWLVSGFALRVQLVGLVTGHWMPMILRKDLSLRSGRHGY